METLPDYLQENLDILFVGHNPSLFSAQVGRYFATPRNRFWGALNRSGLLPESLGPQSDSRVLEFGIGFTDVVKRPSRGAAEVTAQDYRLGAPLLKDKIHRYQPLIVCFHGLTAYAAYLRYGDAGTAQPPGGEPRLRPRLGLQPRTIGVSKVYVVPNPSPANAAFSLDDLVGWYRRLKQLRDSLKPQPPSPLL
jgi:TDG/mug DNA glycosylase family protein